MEAAFPHSILKPAIPIIQTSTSASTSTSVGGGGVGVSSNTTVLQTIGLLSNSILSPSASILSSSLTPSSSSEQKLIEMIKSQNNNNGNNDNDNDNGDKNLNLSQPLLSNNMTEMTQNSFSLTSFDPILSSSKNISSFSSPFLYTTKVQNPLLPFNLTFPTQLSNESNNYSNKNNNNNNDININNDNIISNSNDNNHDNDINNHDNDINDNGYFPSSSTATSISFKENNPSISLPLIKNTEMTVLSNSLLHVSTDLDGARNTSSSIPIENSSSDQINENTTAINVCPCPSYFNRLTCTECGINVHLGCHYEAGGSRTEYEEKLKKYNDNIISNNSSNNNNDGNINNNKSINKNITFDWKCDSCAVDEKDPRCVLCPRRGGAFKQTNDSRWSHVFCGRNAPGQTRLSNNGIIEIRLLPKECKKMKCSICNRQQGACVRCAYLGCSTYFHPLCVERGGKGYLRTRLGEREVFCDQHIPDDVERCGGYLVDGPEIHRLRISLDRSRVILDILLKREKYKLRLCKVESDYFQSNFSRTLDRIKGRKHDESSEGNLNLVDSESEYGDSDDDGNYEDNDKIELCDDNNNDNNDNNGKITDNNKDKDNIINSIVLSDKIDANNNDNNNRKNKNQLKKSKGNTNIINKDIIIDEYQHCPINFDMKQNENIVITNKHGLNLDISGYWHRNNEIHLPRRLGVLVVGLLIQKKDIMVEGGKKSYLRMLKEKIDFNLLNSRSQNDGFGSQKEAIEFNKKIGSSLIEHMKMNEIDFTIEMGKHYIGAYPEFEKMIQKQQLKALKLANKLLKKDNISLNRFQGLYDVPLDLGDSKRKRNVVISDSIIPSSSSSSSFSSSFLSFPDRDQTSLSMDTTTDVLNNLTSINYNYENNNDENINQYNDNDHKIQKNIKDNKNNKNKNRNRNKIKKKEDIETEIEKEIEKSFCINEEILDVHGDDVFNYSGSDFFMTALEKETETETETDNTFNNNKDDNNNDKNDDSSNNNYNDNNNNKNDTKTDNVNDNINNNNKSNNNTIPLGSSETNKIEKKKIEKKKKEVSKDKNDNEKDVHSNNNDNNNNKDILSSSSTPTSLSTLKKSKSKMSTSILESSSAIDSSSAGVSSFLAPASGRKRDIESFLRRQKKAEDAANAAAIATAMIDIPIPIAIASSNASDGNGVGISGSVRDDVIDINSSNGDDNFDYKEDTKDSKAAASLDSNNNVSNKSKTKNKTKIILKRKIIDVTDSSSSSSSSSFTGEVSVPHSDSNQNPNQNSEKSPDQNSQLNQTTNTNKTKNTNKEIDKIFLKRRISVTDGGDVDEVGKGNDFVSTKIAKIVDVHASILVPNATHPQVKDLSSVVGPISGGRRDPSTRHQKTDSANPTVLSAASVGGSSSSSGVQKKFLISKPTPSSFNYNTSVMTTPFTSTSTSISTSSSLNICSETASILHDDPLTAVAYQKFSREFKRKFLHFTYHDSFV